ncbi:hypothetical protein C6A85_11430, partial [Mycobacterium sp. ITM-2017-0098]
ESRAVELTDAETAAVDTDIADDEDIEDFDADLAVDEDIDADDARDQRELDVRHRGADRGGVGGSVDRVLVGVDILVDSEVG